MPPPTNIRPVEPHAPTTSPLLDHFTILRDHLFQFLTTPDFIALLWTSRVFQDDAVVVDRAFEANADVGQFLRRCRPEWCPSTIPEVTETNCFFAAESAMRADYYEGQYRSQWCGFAPIVRGESHFLRGGDGGGNGASLNAWRESLSSPDRCAALLSLAWRMKSELRALLYSETTPNVMTFITLPFILPLARLHEHSPMAAPATALGCHFDNFTTDAGNEVSCALCSAIPAAVEESNEYPERQATEWNEFVESLYAQGLDPNGAEYRARTSAYHEHIAIRDHRYRCEAVGQILLHMCNEGRLPPLRTIGDADDEALEAAVYDNQYEDTFCRTKLRPFAAFSHRHGLGPLHRMEVPFDDDSDEIRRVEMVGAEAPQGFFAGVYYMERYT